MASAREVGRAVAQRLQPVATSGPQAASHALRRVIELAIDGTNRLPSARSTAARHLQKHKSVEPAIEALIDTHVGLASAQAFVTNLGGLITLPIAIPANLTGVAVVQVRLVAAIAHLRGYDINDRRVRTALLMCLLGGEQVGRRIATGRLPSSPMAVATAPVFDAHLDSEVSDAVAAVLLGRVGGRQLPLMVTKRIPVLGGGVSAVLDGMSTNQIGQYAKGELITRRQLRA